MKEEGFMIIHDEFTALDDASAAKWLWNETYEDLNSHSPYLKET